MKGVVLAAAMVLSGCAYFDQQAADHYNKWIGHPADELKISWGAPWRTTPLSAGGEVLRYNYGPCDLNVAIKNGAVYKITYNSPCTAYMHYTQFATP